MPTFVPRLYCGWGCGRAVRITHDRLRELTDADRKPRCATCQARDRSKTPPPSPLNVAILKAVAFCCERDGGPDAVIHDVVVRAWGFDRKTVGIPGHDHPDSKRVHVRVSQLTTGKYSSTTVDGPPLLARTRPNHYRLTPAGAAALAGARRRRTRWDSRSNAGTGPSPAPS